MKAVQSRKVHLPKTVHASMVKDIFIQVLQPVASTKNNPDMYC